MIEFFEEQKNLIVILHTIAMAVGVGAATVTDVFFFKFLKNFKISKTEANILNTTSLVIWGALALAIISGIALYLPRAADLNDTPKFLVKVIVVSVILINGTILNIFVAPKLSTISFTEPHQNPKALLFRKVAFALGAVSMTSWYSALILGSLRNVEFAFSTILVTYLALLMIAVTMSYLMERRLARHAII